MRSFVCGMALLAGAIQPMVDGHSRPQSERTSPHWTSGATGVTARLRGISAVSDSVVWASGSNGTVIRTGDGGESWKNVSVPDTQKLDFRDIDAVDARTAYVLSIGSGDASRIYKTTDAGDTWTLQFRNDDPAAFYDAMAFKDSQLGFAVSDSVDGQLVIRKTTDGGTHWVRLTSALPPALAGEGAYAASGTNVAVHDRQVWIATTASRVIRSTDAGQTWTATATPLPTGTSAGIFSIAFSGRDRGIVVGGDYKREHEAVDNAAVSDDAGRTWTLVKGLSGFRSAVAFVPSRRGLVVAVGPSGSDYSADYGRTWHRIEGPGFHTVSVARTSRHAWAAGDNGSVARLTFPP